MPTKDLHKEPFSEETVTKLEIFESYMEAWIPTFIMSGFEEIYIYDFFAGQGYDKNGTAGSSIRILKSIKKFQGYFLSKKARVNILLNEYDKTKFETLEKTIDLFLADNPKLKYFTKIRFYNEKFEDLFSKIEPELNTGPNLIFLDQNGIKQFSDNNFLKFINFDRTDFLIFISSSYFRRFADDPAFQKHIALNIEEVNKNPYKYIHEVVLNHYKSLIPVGNNIKLYPFSLKKGANIYGLIFGAKHILAVDKFLQIAWNQNSINGSANFDIDGDVKTSSQQISLEFIEFKKKTKIEKFEEQLEKYVLQKERSNIDVYLFTISKAFTHQHATQVIQKMKSEKRIQYKGSPKISYKNYRDQNYVTFEKTN